MTNPFFIIGVRHNPQLGSYLSKAIVAERKDCTKWTTAKFEEYGTKKSLKFRKCGFAKDGSWECISKTECVYGGYEYTGYDSKEKAIEALKPWLEEKSGSSVERAKLGIKHFEEA